MRALIYIVAGVMFYYGWFWEGIALIGLGELTSIGNQIGRLK